MNQPELPDNQPYPYMVRKAQADAATGKFSHPWNPKSEIHGTPLGKLAGLQRTGVTLARLAPGKESFAYHSHQQEEEWVYILSGSAVSRIDGKEYELKAGDFVGFPTPSVAHIMTNPGPDDLIYLMGGENKACEIADFPELDKRMLKLNGQLVIYRLSDGQTIDGK